MTRTATALDDVVVDEAPEPGFPRGVRVLVVDDEAHVRTSMRRILTRAGYDVTTAEDVGPALELAATNPPDIAIVDLYMPTRGIELVRQLKATRGAAIHVAVLSGHSADPDQEACFAAGADEYLVKPIPTPALTRRILAAARTQRAYVEARQAQERADRLRAYGAEAAALLAHDLNNGLAVGLSNVTFVAETITTSDDDVRQALAGTVRALTRMAGLVANFVDIGRLEDDALRPTLRRIRVRDLLLDLVAIHAPAGGTAIRPVMSCAPELEGYFDPALVERVLHNLVGNAIRYCAAGGAISVDAQPHRVTDHELGVELRIANTGEPIAPDLAPALFGKYARGRNGKRGMGLYFCRLAVEAHGGTIAYEPTDEGPLFRIRLPGRAS